MAVTTGGPFTQADGARIVFLGREASRTHHSIGCVVIDDMGDPVINNVTGTLVVEAQSNVTATYFLYRIFNLAAGQRQFPVERLEVFRFRITPVGLNADLSYRFNVSSRD